MKPRVRQFLLFAAIFLFIGVVSAWAFRKAAADFFIERGIFASSSSELDWAKVYFKIAQFFNSGEPRIVAYLCRIALREDSPDAVTYCKRGVASELKTQDANLYLNTVYNSGTAHLRAGHRYLRLGDEDLSNQNYFESESAYKKYIEESGPIERPQTLEYLASLYFYYLNKPEEVLATLEHLISLSSFKNLPVTTQGGVYNLLGRTYLYFDRYQEAQDRFRAAIALNAVPIDSIFNNHFHLNLGYALAKGGKVNEGLKEVELAGKLNPQVFDNCYAARIYYLVNDFNKAVALGLAHQQNPWCSYVLGLSYFATSRKQEAKDSLYKFVNWVDSFYTRYSEAPLDIDYDMPAKSIGFRRAEEKARSILQMIQ